MSTRATYTIYTKGKQTYSFYIHCDGYLAGAAGYIKSAVLYSQDNRGGIADAFIRANPLAEFTRDKDAHGDTEFHYYINENDAEVTAYAIKYNDNGREFVQISKSAIEDFINAGLKQDYKDHVAYLKRTGSDKQAEKPELIYKINGRYYTKASAFKVWEDKIAAYKDYATRFPHYSGNCNGAYEAIGKAFDVIAAINTDADTKLSIAA